MPASVHGRIVVERQEIDLDPGDQIGRVYFGQFFGGNYRSSPNLQG
jgi:hypothetical protein